jgi:hypothetical protein
MLMFKIMRGINTSETPTGPQIHTGIIYSHIIGYFLRHTEERAPDEAVRRRASDLLTKNGARNGWLPKEVLLTGPEIDFTRDSIRTAIPKLPNPGLVRMGAVMLLELFDDVSPEQPEQAEALPEPA